MHQLAYGANTTIAKVVDVVKLVADLLLLAIGELVKVKEIPQGANDVFFGEHARVGLEAKLLVDLVASHICQVKAIPAKEETLEQALGGIERGVVVGALLAIDLEQGLFAREEHVAVERRTHNLVVAQEVENLVVGLRNAQRTQQKRCAHARLAVQEHDQPAVLVDLELEPCAASGDKLDALQIYLAIGLHRLRGVLGPAWPARLLGIPNLFDVQREVHARRSHQLRYDHALGAVDNKGTARSHNGKISHEHKLVLNLACLLVDVGCHHHKRALISEVLSATFGYTV